MEEVYKDYPEPPYYQLYREVAGVAAQIELSMRLFAGKDENVRKRIEEVVKEKREKAKEIRSKYKEASNFVDCRLETLEGAICDVFSERLTSDEVEFLKKTRKKRNKLIHGEFHALLELSEINGRAHGFKITEEGFSKVEVTRFDAFGCLLSFYQEGGFQSLLLELTDSLRIIHKLLGSS